MSQRSVISSHRGHSARNIFDHELCAAFDNKFRRILSTKRMNDLSRSSTNRNGSQSQRRQDYGSPIPQQDSNLPSYSSLKNIPLIPQPPSEARSMRFSSMLKTLSSLPTKWENPGLLDEALKKVPLERIYNDAEEECQVLQAEAASLGSGKKPAWGYQDCVVRALMKWFKTSFFSWVNNPPCAQCGHPTVAVGMAAPTPDEQARGGTQIELYQCAFEGCGNYERFPRYNDAFVLLETRRGRVGEWSNCFGMLCRAMGARVRWVWNSEDHVWLEIFSSYRKRWVPVDVVEQAWDKPKLYTEGWNRKLAYCIGFSADGCMDVTRRYVRNFSKWGKARERCPEPVLLYILNEIRALRRKDMEKQEKFRLEGEEMREYRELQGYVAQAIAGEICKIIPEDFYNLGPAARPSRPDPDAAKAAEAQAERQEAERRALARGPNGARGPPPNQHPDQFNPPR